MLLSQLPEDVLYHILSCLDYKSLCRLSQVCKRIYYFVNRDVVWRKIAKEFLNTGITRNGTDIPRGNIRFVKMKPMRKCKKLQFIESLLEAGCRKTGSHVHLRPKKQIFTNKTKFVCLFFNHMHKYFMETALDNLLTCSPAHTVLIKSSQRNTTRGKYPHIPLKERVKVAQNWYDGVCKKAVPLKWKTKLLPWLQLDRDVLFLSQAADIGAYHQRQDSGRLQRRPFEIYSGHKGDVCRFVLTDSQLISGGSDGKILVHSRNSDMSMELSGHNQEVNCLDAKDGLIISGSRDRTARIWTLTSSCNRHIIPMYDRVWSVAINPSLSSFVTGTACCENLSPLRIWDVDRSECVCSLGSEFRRGAGVLDMVFESPFQLFTCGYDTFIRLWDLRLNPRKCVMEWEEPHDSALYCIQTDGNHMIASGSSYYGVVRFWDRRQTECLQFFQLSSEPVSSPVYCLRFSSSHLYAALATSLHALDFRQSPTNIR